MTMKTVTPARQNGFTLIELLITMIVLAILLAVGIPMYQGITTQMRMKEEIYGFLADVNFARSEAVKRGQPVYVCSTSDNVTCSDVGAASSNWSTGRLVYVDTTNSGLVTTPPNANILRISMPVTHGDTFNGGTAVQITPSGYEIMTGVASLHDNIAGDTGSNQCASITAGSISIVQGAVCP